MPIILTRTKYWNDQTEEEHRRRVQRHLAERRPPLPVITDWTPKGFASAILNDGRWIATCPHHARCGGAELVDPEWPFLVCASGCGRGPFIVLFPENVEGWEQVYASLFWEDD